MSGAKRRQEEERGVRLNPEIFYRHKIIIHGQFEKNIQQTSPHHKIKDDYSSTIFPHFHGKARQVKNSQNALSYQLVSKIFVDVLSLLMVK